jgi:anti-anti-sigma factor
MTVSPFMNVAPIAIPNKNRASQSLIATIALNCELVRGMEEQIVQELMPRIKQESIALDLSRVERIDAAGIAALITLYCTAIEAGRGFYVVSPSARVLDLLRLVGLESILVPAGNSNESPDINADRMQLSLSAA